MKWAAKTDAQKTAEALSIYEWHPWLAWHPVRIGDEWCWLQFIDRRLLYRYGEDHQMYVWEYRA